MTLQSRYKTALHNSKPLLWILTILLFSGCGGDSNPVEANRSNELVQNIILQTNLDSLTLSVQELSGEITVDIRGGSYVIRSRHKNAPGNDLAADYIQTKLERYGLEVENEYFSASGRNVYAIQAGTRNPEQFYIICAHYDCMPGIEETAPGSDDNASGSATVLEAARLLSKYTTDYTVIYAFWDEEEQGLLGSRYFATKAGDTNIDIVGVINIDMIGWDNDDDNTVMIDRNDDPISSQLAANAMTTNERYTVGLVPQVTVGFGRSDHVSFWQNRFGAILIIEDFRDDFNQYYHTPDDQLLHFNPVFFHKCARLAIGTLAAMVEADTPLITSTE